MQTQNQKVKDNGIGKVDTFTFKPKVIQDEAKKLNLVMKLSKNLNVPKILEHDLKRVFDFMQKLPMFQNKFNDLMTYQYRQCLEKMKIKLLERGTVVLKQGYPPKYAYGVLLG